MGATPEGAAPIGGAKCCDLLDDHQDELGPRGASLGGLLRVCLVTVLRAGLEATDVELGLASRTRHVRADLVAGLAPEHHGHASDLAVELTNTRDLVLVVREAGQLD